MTSSLDSHMSTNQGPEHCHRPLTLHSVLGLPPGTGWAQPASHSGSTTGMEHSGLARTGGLTALMWLLRELAEMRERHRQIELSLGNHLPAPGDSFSPGRQGGRAQTPAGAQAEGEREGGRHLHRRLDSSLSKQGPAPFCICSAAWEF